MMVSETEQSSTTRVLRRHSQAKVDDLDHNMEVLDDSVSTGTGSAADDSSRSETPSQGSKRAKSAKCSSHNSSATSSKLSYKCTNSLKEDHGGPIFCVQFHNSIRPGQPLMFATVGSNRASIYECSDCLMPAISVANASGQNNHANSSRKRTSDALDSSSDSHTSATNESLTKFDVEVSQSGTIVSQLEIGATVEQENTESQQNKNSSEIRSAVGGSAPVRTGKIRLVQSYIDADADENLYSCAWTTDRLTSHPLLAIAGSRGLVRIIDTATGQCIQNLVGHGQAINDVKFLPRDSNIVLSVSKDHSMRLWNIVTGICIAIFGGVDGHRDEVLNGDMDIEGRHLVSCGMDHSVKVWRLDKPCLETAIALSYTHNSNKASEKPFATFCQHYPDFSTRDVHSNYVDCAMWYGHFIISKSCENEVICWKPGRLSDLNIGTPVKSTTTAGGGSTAATGQQPSDPQQQNVTILHKFEVRDCDIWFIRFCMDYRRRLLAVGNQAGRVYVWDLECDDWNQSKPAILSHSKCGSAIRQTCLSIDGSILLCVCDDSTIWRWDRQ